MNKLFDFGNKLLIVKKVKMSLLVSVLLTTTSLLAAPSGGVVTSGKASINQNANVTNINQSSNKASINWQNFSINSNEIVNFNQPNKSSITLNRVIGNEKSIIDGALNANGQVWILNSNGVLFGKNAKVNTSGVLATTKELSNKDFNSGNYNFKGDSTKTIKNLGNINSQKYAAFIANSVINNGKIEVYKGDIHLIGANEFRVNIDEASNLSLKVTKGALNALVENNHILLTNGGSIYLTTNAKNELLKGVVNNKGIIEAHSLNDLQSKVILFAHGGTTNIDGIIDAKDGFVETSGKNLNVTNNSKIVAKKWLIDPQNVLIDNSNGSIGNEKVGASVIENSLNNGTDVIIQADNNITVNENITYNKSELELNAGNDIYINKIIDVNETAGLFLVYAKTSADGTYYINNTNQNSGKINLADKASFKTQEGTNTIVNWTIINNKVALENINNNLTGNYVLGSDIDLNGINWKIIGGSFYNSFKGEFDGLGHIVSNLKINNSTSNYQGLFGYVNRASIKNVGVINADVSGRAFVGGLVGYATSSTILNSYAIGEVSGTYYAGGLIGGAFYLDILNSYSIAKIRGDDSIGGLVGYSLSSYILNSYTTGSVKGGDIIGGLLGRSSNSSNILDSYSTSEVSGNNVVGGLIGYAMDSSTILNSYATGNVKGNRAIGGLVGELYEANISNSYATGSVKGEDIIGGLLGRATNTSTISNSYSISEVRGVGNNIGGLLGYLDKTSGIKNSYYDKTVNPQYADSLNLGRTSKELQDINTFVKWDIVEDNNMALGMPFLKNGAWVIGTKINSRENNADDNITKNKSSDSARKYKEISNIENIAYMNTLNNTSKDLSIDVIDGGIRVPLGTTN